jgi:gamma-butyrobetaine dioxygenase
LIDIAAAEPLLWNKNLQDSIPTFEYSDIRDHDRALLAWCEAIRDVGLTIVRGAPNKSGEIERFAERVAFVRETIYDRVHTVRATPGEYNAYNVASTSLELKPHTDMPVYDQPPGVQMFHFLVNESSGGNSTAVDGFYVAERLKEADPEAYRILASTPLDYRMNSARGDVQGQNPILSLDVRGQLKVFRYSNQLAQPARISSDTVERFYRAYQLLGRMLEDPNHMVEFRLNTGDMMATNNLRVLHGRKAFDPTTGDRHLQLTYMDMDDVLSRIRMIKNSAQVH